MFNLLWQRRELLGQEETGLALRMSRLEQEARGVDHEEKLDEIEAIHYVHHKHLLVARRYAIGH